MRRNTLLMATDNVHSHEPFLKWKFSVFKDSPNKTREIRESKCSSSSFIVQGICIYLYLKPKGILQKRPGFLHGLLVFMSFLV